MNTYSPRSGIRWAIAGACVLGAALIASSGLPSVASGLFDGPDGTRWAGPFIRWIGLAAAIFVALVPRLARQLRSRTAVAGLGILAGLLAVMLFVAIQRISSGVRVYEDYNVLLAMQVAHGINLYGDPASAPTGSIYPPGFFLLAGLAYRAFPLVAGIGRVVSIASFLVTAALVVASVNTRTRSVAASLWAGALFSATYGVLGCIYDNIGVDALSMVCTAAVLHFLLRRTPRSDAWALFFAGCACFVKQPGLFPLLFVCGTMVAARRPPRAYAPLLFWGLVGVAFLAITRGRAWEYLVVYPAGHGWQAFPDPRVLMRLFVLQMPLWALAIYGVAASRDVRLGGFALSVLIPSLLGIWKSGGWTDALFPFEPVLCVAAGFGLYRLSLLTSKGLALRRIVPALLVALQLLPGVYNPFGALYPWATVRDIDTNAIEIARAVPGEVWFPAEGRLAFLAGKRVWDHFAAIESVCWSGRPVPPRLLDAIESGRFESIVCRTDSYQFFRSLPPAIGEAVARHYRPEEASGLIVFRPIASRVAAATAP